MYTRLQEEGCKWAPDLVGEALLAGDVVSLSDGGKTWLRNGAPFVALQRGNDWGHEYLAYKAKGDHGECSIKYSIQAKEGQVVEVLWPDRTITKEPVVLQVSNKEYYDHGHRNAVIFALPGVMAEAHGLRVWVPLDSEGLKVRSDAF